MGRNYLKFNLSRGLIGHRVTESESYRVTEWLTPKGTQYTGGWNFFEPDFNKLPYSLRSQGDNVYFVQNLKLKVFYDDNEDCIRKMSSYNLTFVNLHYGIISISDRQWGQKMF